MKETRSDSKIVMLTKIAAIDVEGQKIYNLITKVIKLVKLVQSLESFFCIALFQNIFSFTVKPLA